MIADSVRPEGKVVHLVGVGNSIRSDDAFGLEVVSSLRRRYGRTPPANVIVHPISSQPERVLSKLAASGGRVVVFDSVEAGKEPGTVVCARLSDTKYGFFATHNIPLRLVPGLVEIGNEVVLVGIQPENLAVGERLSPPVKEGVEKIVEAIVGATRGG